MRQHATWGGHVEVQALARALGMNAIIYQPTDAGSAKLLLSSAVEVQAAESKDAGCVQLSFHPQHHAGQHYNSVRYADDDGAGPATLSSTDELRRRIEDSLRPPEPEPVAEVEQKSAKGRSAKIF